MHSNNFFAYLSRMKYINRWGLMRNTSNENIEEHSYRVAVLAHALAVIGNIYFGETYDEGKVTLIALFHDCSEIITGDMPTPVKYYNPAISDAYKSVESIANERLLSMLPCEMAEKYREYITGCDAALHRIVKAADKLSAYIKCIEETKAGNNEFSKAGEATYEAIKSMKLPEAEYFLENFVEPYKLTLDELN